MISGCRATQAPNNDGIKRFLVPREIYLYYFAKRRQVAETTYGRITFVLLNVDKKTI